MIQRNPERSTLLSIVVCLGAGLAMLAPAGLAAPAAISSFQLIEYGLYQTDDTADDPDDALPVHLKTTNVVPARAGTEFGFSYFLTGSPEGLPVSLNTTKRFPLSSLRQPETSEAPGMLGNPHFASTLMQEEADVLPIGPVVMEIWYNTTLLGSKQFMVVSPEAADGRSPPCLSGYPSDFPCLIGAVEYTIEPSGNDTITDTHVLVYPNTVDATVATLIDAAREAGWELIAEQLRQELYGPASKLTFRRDVQHVLVTALTDGTATIVVVSGRELTESTGTPQ